MKTSDVSKRCNPSALTLPSPSGRGVGVRGPGRAWFALIACLFVGEVLAVMAPSQAAAEQPATLRVYIGTYTSEKSQGIYLSKFDVETGELTKPQLVAVTTNPSFLAIHPSKRFLYAANEVGDYGGESSGAVSAYAIDSATGGLTFLNQHPSRGGGPCHLVVDATGKNVLVANYGGGSVAVLPIGPDGRLSPASAFAQHQGSSVNPRRQEGPHAHSINLDAANRLAFAADLGLDKVLVYRFDASGGTLAENDPPSASVDPGAGPRHFAFHPGGRFAYVINEIASTVTAFAYDAQHGRLDPIQTVPTLPEGFEGTNSTADIHVHPSGRFLYGSNRGHDSIAVFRVDPQSGKLAFVEHEPTQGRSPRNFNIDPTGAWLLAANHNGDNIVVFRIDRDSGELEPSGHSIEAPTPVCIQFVD